MHFDQDDTNSDALFASEESFSMLFPDSIMKHDKLHWSPLPVIQKATGFLAEENDVKILDIGCGVGKFCLAGAYEKPKSSFYGVEQRQYLIDIANSAKDKLGTIRVEFIHNNFTQVDIKGFDGFYFYNSFFENLPIENPIDDNVVLSPDLYYYYTNYLRDQFERMPAGTRIATYCSWDDEIPPDYQMVESHFTNLLKFWVKN